jgi:hypothetical protein
MKERVKWFLVGVGVMYLMQVLILLLIHNFIPAKAPPEFSILLGTVVYTLIAFFAGGFVIGWMAERIEIIEPTLATIVTLGIDVITSQAGLLSGLFLFTYAVSQRSYGIALTLGAVAIVASLAGAFAGERMKIPEEDWISHTLVVSGLAGLALGPFLLMGAFLPRGIAIVIGAILLGGILFVSRWFKRQDIIEEEEMSIRPETARKAKGHSVK